MKIEYKNVSLKNINLELIDRNALSNNDKQVNRDYNGLNIIHGKSVRSVIVDDEKLYPTGRFWSSLYSTFGLNTAFFRYFDPDEIFKRIAERGVDTIKVCVERQDSGNNLLLAISGLNKPTVVYDDWIEILKEYKGDDIKYHHGIVTSTHSPRIPGEFNIANDKFARKFNVYTPIDGFGSPNIYVSLLRYVCSNGAIGFANAFKTALALGSGSDSVSYTLKRALESFSNDEGYSALHDRFASAAQSWASVREQQELYNIILHFQNDPVLIKTIRTMNNVKDDDLTVGVGNALIAMFEKVTGKPFEMFLHVGPKKQRSMPVACKVYDMLNFATELATHNLTEDNARKLHAWVGKTLAGDYDLESSADAFDIFRGRFVDATVGKPE